MKKWDKGSKKRGRGKARKEKARFLTRDKRSKKRGREKQRRKGEDRKYKEGKEKARFLREVINFIGEMG